jgi:hypothetical protein
MLTKLVNIIKSYIIPIGGGISVIAGGIMYVYSLGIKAERSTTHNISLEMKVDKLITSDSLKSIKIDSLYYGQRRMLRSVTSIGNTVGIVKTQLGNHIIKTSQDKDEILNWVNAFEEKKNSMRGFSQTQ